MWQKTNQDFEVVLIAATSIDGFIGPVQHQRSFDWTSKADKKLHVSVTKQLGAVIFGRTTYQTFNKPLPGRLNLVYTTSQPDSFAQISIQDLVELQGETQLYTTQLSPSQIITKLKTAGYPGLSVSGGSTVYTQFLQAGVVDTLLITTEPIVFGQGIPLFSEVLAHQNFNLQLLDQDVLEGGTQLSCYSVRVAPESR